MCAGEEEVKDSIPTGFEAGDGGVEFERSRKGEKEKAVRNDHA